MDSRIIESKKARKTIGRIIEKRIKHNGSPKSCDACKADMALSRIDEALALLTAEPEPCPVQAEPEFPSHPGGYSGGEPEPCEDAAPAIDPISGMHFFMMIKHPEKGWVPTYGGPYDSYTLCERDDDGIETDVVGFTRERYDHDEGGWVEGCEILDCALVTRHKASEISDKREEELREAIDEWGCKHEHPNILSEIDESLATTEPKDIKNKSAVSGFLNKAFNKGDGVYRP